jgi:DNA-binding GntR family transcriptional regulator
VALGRTAGWHEVVEPDLRFHSALVDAAGSPRMARTYAAIQAEIAYCVVQLRPHYDRPEQVAREHRELLDAIVARNAALAVELMRTHLLDAEARLLGALPESSRDHTLATWKE